MEDVHIPGALSCDAAGNKHGLNYRKPILWGEGPECRELQRFHGIYRIGGSGIGGGGLRDALLV